jgi:hypothetical protein
VALPPPPPPAAAVASAARPIAPPEIQQYFSPDAAVAVSTPLRPVIYGAASVRFSEPKLKVDTTKPVWLTAGISDRPVPVDWQSASRVDWAPEMLEHDPPDHARFAEVPSAALKPKNYDAWTKQLLASLAATEAIDLFRSPSTGELSRPDESEREFRARLQQTSREGRDRGLDGLRRKFAPRQTALEEKRRRANQAIARESEQATGQKLQTAISFGATLVGALLGRKAISATTLGRATTAARGIGRSMKESEDVERARQTAAVLEKQRQELEAEFASEAATLAAANDVAAETLETMTIKPKKTNITVKLVALVWTK